MTPVVLYLRRSRLFRSFLAANIAVAPVFAVWPDRPGTAFLVGVAVFAAAYVGFEKWCQHKGWGELSDYPEARQKKHLRWLLNLSVHGLIDVLLVGALVPELG